MGETRFDELYRQYGAVIYARCRRMLGQDQAAEDATQEVFCRVARNLHKAPSRSLEVVLWMQRISRNYCLNEIRNAKRHPPVTELTEHAAETAGEDVVSSRDLASRLIERVPVHLRASAWLHHVDGMSHEEVGKALGISRRTVINYISEFEERARRFVGTQPRRSSADAKRR